MSVATLFPLPSTGFAADRASVPTATDLLPKTFVLKASKPTATLWSASVV